MFHVLDLTILPVTLTAGSPANTMKTVFPKPYPCILRPFSACGLFSSQASEVLCKGENRLPIVIVSILRLRLSRG